MAGSETAKIRKGRAREEEGTVLFHRTHHSYQDSHKTWGRRSMKAGVLLLPFGPCLEQLFSYSPHLLKMSASEERSCPGVQKSSCSESEGPGLSPISCITLCPALQNLCQPYSRAHEVQAPWLGSQTLLLASDDSPASSIYALPFSPNSQVLLLGCVSIDSYLG